MLKTLAALAVLQLCATAFLIARLDEANHRLALAEAAIAAKKAPPARIVSTPQPARSEPMRAGESTLGANALRQIIREEFAMLRVDSGAAHVSGAVAAAPIPPDPKKSAAVRRDFDRLLSMRTVETRDLDRFLELATALPEIERKKALSDLSRAMNDGRIEGQF